MVEILYGKGSMTCPVEPNAVLTAHGGQEKAEISGSELVRQAMEAPIGSEPLFVLAKGKARATVIISDHTRPVPSKDILPRMLQELREGNPDIQITLLVATGCHRGTTKDELVAKLGKEIAEREQIKVHDAFAKEDNVEIGILPSGAPLVIDRAAVETDLLVAEGLISLPASPADARAFCPASAAQPQSTATTAAPSLRMNIPARACWWATPSTGT